MPSKEKVKEWGSRLVETALIFLAIWILMAAMGFK